jgi:glycosyltransferase involved in cell wall biosynthesis
MRIAQVSPLYESVPPSLYGGTERVIFYLTEELIRRGHEVTLFASGDSKTSATLVPFCPRALRLDPNCVDPLAHHILMLEKVQQRATDFDIIHYHIDYLHFPVSRRQPAPQVTTLHGRLDIPDVAAIFNEYRDMPLVSISNSQRSPFPDVRWLGTVYHGLPKNYFHLNTEPADYLAFLGRISPEKGLDEAIRIAIGSGSKLRVAAKIDKVDRQYFETVIRPLFSEYKSAIEYVGEISDREKNSFLGSARALLFPVNWPEPFGLVLLESMACGTPIIAYNRGSVPEIIDHGKSGYIVNGTAEAIHAVRNISQINRTECHQVFSERFTVEKMAEGYLKIYEQVIGEKKKVH